MPSRTLRLPSRALTAQELERLTESIESGDLNVEGAFSSIIERYVEPYRKRMHDEIVIRATSDLDSSDFTTFVAIGISFVPADSDVTDELIATMRNCLETAGLARLVRYLQINDRWVDMA